MNTKTKRSPCFPVLRNAFLLRWVLCALLTLTLATASDALTPLAPLPELERAPNTAHAELGRMLFFDKRLGADATISCSDCHDPEKGWADGMPLSKGYPGALYFRNTPTVLNAVHGKYLYWDGRFWVSDLSSLVRDHLSEAHFMQADGRLLVERMRQIPEYEAMFTQAFGREPTYGSILNSITAFLQTLRSQDVPFDRYLQGERNAISESARRGLELFSNKAGCIRCHDGPMVSDGKFHNLGLATNQDIFETPERHITFRRFFKTLGIAQYASLRTDLGLYAITKQAGDRGGFRTPTLRELAHTAPYMHDGSLDTLEDVVAFYNRGGGEAPGKDSLLRPLGLSAAEQTDLVEFLTTLSGKPIMVEEVTLPEYRLRALGGEEKLFPFGGNPIRADRPKVGNAIEISLEDFPPLATLPDVPVPPDNPITPAKVKLGKMLYFDKRTSGDTEISCASCHDPALGWGDEKDISTGYPGTRHWRNGNTVINSAFLHKLFWGGESLSLELQAKSAITGNLAGNGDPVMIEERLAQIPEYVELFEEAFGVTRPSFLLVLKAIATFERAEAISADSPFDQYMRGDTSAMSEAALRGMELFQGKAGCIQCHNGPLLTDQKMHILGVPDNPFFKEDVFGQIAMRYQHYGRGVSEEMYRDAKTDYGLYYTTKRPEDKGKFRTPPLRYLRYTYPFMHNGVFIILEEVVDFYNEGGGGDPNKSPLLKPLNLTDEEKEDLVEFLDSLSGSEMLMESPALPDYAVLD